MSYAAQTPWLEHLSIKDNILFGSPYEEDKYNEVLECSALLPDLETFEDRDRTEIGERGVSLSGGQKARCVHIDLYRFIHFARFVRCALTNHILIGSAELLWRGLSMHELNASCWMFL